MTQARMSKHEEAQTSTRSRTGASALTSDDLFDVNIAASKIKVQGARYPEKLEQ
jgi:hypothetical protein